MKELSPVTKDFIKGGVYILNERPEGMSYEDYKLIRKELNGKRKLYLKNGIPKTEK